MVTKAEYEAKWSVSLRSCVSQTAGNLIRTSLLQGFFEQGFEPWTTEGPASQLVHLVEKNNSFAALRSRVQQLGRRLSCCEPGCGQGAATRWLAGQGFESVGVDLIEGVIAKARMQAQIEAQAEHHTGVLPKPIFVQADVFSLPCGFSYAAAAAGQAMDEEQRTGDAPGGGPAFDFVFDCQCFHVLQVHDEAAAVVSVARLLRPGGLLLCMVGNANEPEVSPAVLSQEELQAAFVSSSGGLFRMLECREDRFDPTPAYSLLPLGCPLAWVALFERTEEAVPPRHGY